MFDLSISLGHNSSAALVFTETGAVVSAIEQERLDRIKSSSSSPIDAALQTIKLTDEIDVNDIKNIFISHWFDTFDIDEVIRSKYTIDFTKFFPNANFVSHTEQFTHHDAHVRAAVNFLRKYTQEPLNDWHTIVADGFGNFQEVVSVYSDQSLVNRVHGYKNSLGLLYQFATSFCGMKENQDEYKFLGYESLITQVLTKDQITILESYANSSTEAFLIGHSIPYDTPLGLIDVTELERVRKLVHERLTTVVHSLGIVTSVQHHTSTEVRAIVGYFIQKVVEQYFCALIETHKIKKLLVSGGCFYNVKLNNLLASKVDKFCAYPLAGDQGAALGFSQTTLDSLFLGKRRLHHKVFEHNSHIKIFASSEEALPFIVSEIEDSNIVNVIGPSMEFGPRALGMTSSLFLPTRALVDRNNMLNQRAEVMPCAPILTKDTASNFFDQKDLDKVIGSSEFMITAFDYTCSVGNIMGVAHNKPLMDGYTGRPQLIDENHYLHKLFQSFEILVNTSFNVHGNPIVYDSSAILMNFNFQLERAKQMGCKFPKLVIING